MYKLCIGVHVSLQITGIMLNFDIIITIVVVIDFFGFAVVALFGNDDVFDFAIIDPSERYLTPEFAVRLWFVNQLGQSEGSNK